MTCHNTRKGLQRFRCLQCRKTFTEDHPMPLGTKYTSVEDAAKAIELLCEGCSASTAERVTGIHHATILSLLTLVGSKCERLLERRIQGLPVTDVQADEIWGFVGCKEKHNVKGDPEKGDAYCFVGIERNTKLVLTWHLLALYVARYNFCHRVRTLHVTPAMEAGITDHVWSITELLEAA